MSPEGLHSSVSVSHSRAVVTLAVYVTTHTHKVCAYCVHTFFACVCVCVCVCVCMIAQCGMAPKVKLECTVYITQTLVCVAG